MAKNKKDPFADHKKPVTRRDFLARGTLGFSASLFAPSLLGTLLRSTRAGADGGSCGAAVSNGLIPMLVFDCAGGAALAGNFLVGGAGGPEDLLPAYDVLGWNPRESGALDNRFGLPMSAKYSKILAGILASSDPKAQANLRMGSFCHLSQDDSQINSTSSLILAIEAGAAGSIVNRGIGGAVNAGGLLSPPQTLSGGNSGAAEMAPAYQPILANSINDVLGAVSFGPALSNLSVASRRGILQAALSMSVEQLNKLSQGNPGAFAQQMNCGFQTAMGYADVAPQLDPRNNADISKIYNINAQTDAADPALVTAAIVMNVLKGQTGPGVISIGGCDYHDGSQTTGDGIDLTIGTQIGQALQAAYILKTPFFFQIITDGALSADSGTRNWSGDAGFRGMTVIGYYNPNTVPTFITANNRQIQQIGAFNAGQGADESTVVGADTGMVAYATYANYLQICGQLGAHADQLNAIFGTGGVDQLLVFNGS
jgi:hypothetical protein